ncbi:hypothetical protein [uncultured Kordia sp.]|nr:hypothetical protein [uncultured Kordia sp.]
MKKRSLTNDTLADKQVTMNKKNTIKGGKHKKAPTNVPENG